jgi:hypothetical protein
MSTFPQSSTAPSVFGERRRSERRRRGSAAAPAGGASQVPTEAIEHTIRHTALRGLGFVGLLAIALIHLLDVIAKLAETPYVGVMYILLMVASVGVAFALLHTGSPRVWAAGGLLAAMTLVGFILSRTTGLPNSSGDIGNWSEGLGLASMLVEATVVLLSGYAVWLSRREARPGVHRSVATATTE